MNLQKISRIQEILDLIPNTYKIRTVYGTSSQGPIGAGTSNATGSITGSITSSITGSTTVGITGNLTISSGPTYTLNQPYYFVGQSAFLVVEKETEGVWAICAFSNYKGTDITQIKCFFNSKRSDLPLVECNSIHLGSPIFADIADSLKNLTIVET